MDEDFEAGVLLHADGFRATPLHRACRYGEDAMVVAWLCGQQSVNSPLLLQQAGLLGENCARPHAPSPALLLSGSKHDFLPLHSATGNGHTNDEAACCFVRALQNVMPGKR